MDKSYGNKFLDSTEYKSGSDQQAHNKFCKEKCVVYEKGNKNIVKFRGTRNDCQEWLDKQSHSKDYELSLSESTELNLLKELLQISEEWKRPAPFTDVSEEDIIKLISKKTFINNLATMKRTFNAKYFNIEKMTGVAFYLDKRKTSTSSFSVHDKDVTLLHAAVYWKDKFNKERDVGGNPAAVIITCHSQDGKTWGRDSINQSDGYFTENPLDKDSNVKLLKCFLSNGTEVKSPNAIAKAYDR